MFSNISRGHSKQSAGNFNYQLRLKFLSVTTSQSLANIAKQNDSNILWWLFLAPLTASRNQCSEWELLPTYMHHYELKLDSNKANLTAEGHRLDNLPVPSMPSRPRTDLCFFQLNINYRQIKTTQLHRWTFIKQIDTYTVVETSLHACIYETIVLLEDFL